MQINRQSIELSTAGHRHAMHLDYHIKQPKTRLTDTFTAVIASEHLLAAAIAPIKSNRNTAETLYIH